MKMAKASEADLEMAMALCNALDSLTSRWSASVPQDIANCEEDSTECFDRDNKEQCQRVLGHLLDIVDRASLMRVVWGCAVMLDPANELVNPDSDVIEHHPKRQQLEQQRDKLLAALQAVIDFVEGKPDAVEPFGLVRTAIAESKVGAG